MEGSPLMTKMQKLRNAILSPILGVLYKGQFVYKTNQNAKAIIRNT